MSSNLTARISGVKYFWERGQNFRRGTLALKMIEKRHRFCKREDAVFASRAQYDIA